MRNITYRAMTDEFDGFIYNIPYVDGFGNWCMKNPISGMRIIVKRETITIGTGKRDKNNIEIFEGDIIAIPSAVSDKIYKFVVGYSEKDMSFVLYEVNEKSNTFSKVGMYYDRIVNSCEFCSEDIEVVGNVFDTIPRLRARDIYEEDDEED